ncbi:MAG: cadherin repeat domain-containing protein, partial [Lachnospiraceae bacterium]|nr:cadherin repeat domain-containing protein [Lachnospiraceae bacterium]
KMAADSMGLYGLINCGTSTRKEDYHGVLISGGTVNATGGTSTAKKYPGSSGGSKAYATSSGIAGYVYSPEANAYAVELKDDARVKATGGEVSGPGWDNASRGVRILPGSSSLNYYGLVIGEVDKEAVEISGQTSAIYGQVFNAVSGTGWSNAEGTQGRTEIAVSGEGRELNYKKTVFAAAGGVDPTSVPAPIGKELTYNGKAQTGVDEGEGYTLSGTYSATNAGAYQATATLKDGYIWSDGTSEAKNIVWKINKANVSVTVPAGKSYTYDGKKKTGVAAGDGYTLSGTASATNAGNYSAKATLVNDPNRTYKWSDGTSAAKTISWKINKADNTMTAAAAKATLSVTYNADKAVTTVKSVNVEKAKGAVKFTNASTNATAKKFKVDEKNSKITVPKGTKADTYKVKIKVTAAASDNYKSASKTVSFNVKVKQADNPLAIKAKKKSYPFTYSKKKAQTLKAKDAYTISKKGKGKVTYTLASAKNKKGTNVKNKFKVDKSTGDVTLKKDLAKSTYTVKVKVKAEGNNNYKGATKDVQIKIVVK